MKEFDLQAAKNGAPVMTCDGHPARIICFDYKNPRKPLVVIIDDRIDKDCLVYDLMGTTPKEGIWLYSPNGKRSSAKPEKDLVMATRHYEGYVHICAGFVINNGYIFDTKEKAEENRESDVYVAKIEWEE